VQVDTARLGVMKFTNRTLHRPYSRMPWLACVPIETIKDMLGHEDT
jgi:hypothetical protein